MKAPKLAAIAVTGTLVLGACGTTGSFGRPKIEPADERGLGGPAAVAEMKRLYEAAKKDGESEIIVYGPTEDDRAPIYRRFEKSFPGIIVRGDQITGAELVGRVNQEVASERRTADIIQTGDTTTVGLAKTGRFQRFRPSTAAGLPPRFADPGGLYGAASDLPFGIAYNNKKVAAKDAPRGWDDFTRPKWRGKIVWDNPTSAGAALSTAAHVFHDGRHDQSWLRAVAGQDVGLKPNAAGVGSALATGEYPVALAYPYNFYLSAVHKDAPISFVFPVRGGSHLSPNFLGLLAGAPRPNAAKLLITWLFSPVGQRAVADIGQYPTMPGAAPPKGLPPRSQVDELKPMPLKGVGKITKDTLSVTKQVFR